jgi:hypothetical protein
MNGTGKSWPILLTAVLAGAGLAAAACGSSSPPVSAPPASPHTAKERAATLSWLAQTNQMWTRGNFAALDQVTTGEMRAIYRTEQRQARAAGVSRKAFRLTGLSITVPCHRGPGDVFVAYGDTDVFTLGQSTQPVAMVFQRSGRAWKLAAAVDHPAGDPGWPALCRHGAAPAAAAVLAPGSYVPDLARVLTTAMTGAAMTTATAAPFAINGFLAGSGSVTGQAARWMRQDRKAGVTLTGRFAPAGDSTFAFPLASGRGYWLIGFLTQSNSHSSPSGLRTAAWPDGSPDTTARLAVVHHQTDTFITTYTAIDPLRSAARSAVLDGFFGWQLATRSS